MYKRKRAGNTITRKINSTKDTAAKADKNHYISNSYLEGFIPIDTEYFTASSIPHKWVLKIKNHFINQTVHLLSFSHIPASFHKILFLQCVKYGWHISWLLLYREKS